MIIETTNKVIACDFCKKISHDTMYKCPGCGKHICYKCRDNKTVAKHFYSGHIFYTERIEITFCLDCMNNPPKGFGTLIKKLKKMENLFDGYTKYIAVLSEHPTLNTSHYEHIDKE